VVLLNTDFEGGGTRYWDRSTKAPLAHVQESTLENRDGILIPGQILIHPAAMNHEGVAVTSGTRYLLTGFLAVDYTDLFERSTTDTSKSRTGLSVYASWLNLNWLQVKLKEGFVASLDRLRGRQRRENPEEDEVATTAAFNHVASDVSQKWTDDKYVRSFFYDAANVLRWVGDNCFAHGVEDLVHPDNRTEYLKALDRAGHATSEAKEHDMKASWFRGQQIQLDVDGSMMKEWATRQKYSDRFQEL